MAVKVTMDQPMPDGSVIHVEGDTAAEVITAFWAAKEGLTTKPTPTPTPDPPPGA